MNTFSFKKEGPFIIILIIPFIIALTVFPYLPEQVPIHWNIHGEVDNYASKEFGAFFMPLLNVGLYALFLLTPYIDPKKKNYSKFMGSYTIIRYTIHLFFLLIYCLTTAASLHYNVDIGLWVATSVSVLFIAMGNILGRVRHNYFVGIKLPWTLASEEVWRKTHLLGSKLMVAGGFFSLLGILLFQDYLRFIFLMTGIFLPIIITTVYSYFYYKKVNNNIY